MCFDVVNIKHIFELYDVHCQYETITVHQKVVFVCVPINMYI